MTSIPDFDTLMKVAENIRDLLFEKMELDTEIKLGEAEVFKQSATNEEYFVNGKPPSVSYIENTYKFTGLKNELVPVRKKYSEVTAQLEHAKLTWEIFKFQLDLYRTESANSRVTTL